MENRFYALLAPVGVYEIGKRKNLPSWKMDLELMKTALVQGLEIPDDNIRISGENGVVTSRSFARNIAEISKYVSEEDGFIFYFSGHGDNSGLCFSDAAVSIQSIIEFIKKIKAKKGFLPLSDINEEVKQLIKILNMKNSDRIQHPIYRASLGGTIFFQVEEYKTYQSLQVYLEKNDYIIQSVEPLSTLKEKRLAVFILVKEKSNARQLSVIMREAVQEVKYADVYSTQKMEDIHGHKSADAIWFYFGYDESDMVNHRYFATGIWCCNSVLQKKYFRNEKNAEVIEEMWISQDSSYEIVRKLQQTDISEEQFRQQAKQLLSKTVSMAEQFIADLEEVDNRTKTIKEVQREYKPWIRQVYEEYYKMTEIPVPPDELHDWFGVVEDLVGCVLDMALELRKDVEFKGLDRWVFRNCVRRYYEDLERLRGREV